MASFREGGPVYTWEIPPRQATQQELKKLREELNIQESIVDYLKYMIKAWNTPEKRILATKSREEVAEVLKVPNYKRTYSKNIELLRTAKKYFEGGTENTTPPAYRLRKNVWVGNIARSEAKGGIEWTPEMLNTGWTIAAFFSFLWKLVQWSNDNKYLEEFQSEGSEPRFRRSSDFVIDHSLEDWDIRSWLRDVVAIEGEDYPDIWVDVVNKLIDGESNWNPDAYNKWSKAYGLWQFIPWTWDVINRKYFDWSLRKENPVDQIKAIYANLHDIMEYRNCSAELALAFHNTWKWFNLDYWNVDKKAYILGNLKPIVWKIPGMQWKWVDDVLGITPKQYFTAAVWYYNKLEDFSDAEQLVG